MTSLTIYVAYHAAGPHPDGVDGYRAVCNVGAEGKRPEGFSHYDAENGFPTRNAAYCELSPLRALDVEADADWIGLAHYRRLLVSPAAQGDPDRYPGFRRVREFDWADLAQVGADARQLKTALDGVDWASSVRLDVRRLGFATLWDQYSKTHTTEQIDTADRVVGRNGGERLQFSDYLRSRSALRPFNMMVGRADLVRDYLRWLWPVLDDAYSEIGDASGTYERRWPGFLAERLLNYWLDVVREGTVRERQLPVLLLHDARIRNSRVPAQGEQQGRVRPRRNRLIARALSVLPPEIVMPIAREEMHRATGAVRA